MKITRLTLHDNSYNALQHFDQPFVFIPEKKNIIEPICLVGSNGSGKSNLLELITELFFHVELDIRLIQQGKKPKTKIGKRLSIEYKLFKQDKEIDVRISSNNSRTEWEVFELLEQVYVKVSRDEIAKVKSLLPEKIIAYSSGQNESLSYWFSEISKEYSREVREAADNQLKTYVEDSRLIFLDYDCNSSIVLANYLFGSPESFDAFKTNLRLRDVTGFRMVMDFKLVGKNYVRLSKEHRDYIKRFQSCASMFRIEKVKVKFPHKKIEVEQEGYCVFDFYVTDATRAAIRKNFDSAYQLFMAFQKFELLNHLKLSGVHTRSSNSKDKLHRPPIVGHEERIFRFDNIDLKIEKLDLPISYIGISDGEHQFLQAIGTILLFDQRNVLFLLDEPETHFNPQWRRNMVSILQNKTTDRYQEIILTTHSPFVVSDCRKYNVFLFQRVENRVTFKPFEIETFGTAVETILLKAFGMEESISTLAKTEIEDILKEDDYLKAKQMLERLGSSFEKMEAARHVKSLAPKE